jgi:hypothetical protein
VGGGGAAQAALTGVATSVLVAGAIAAGWLFTRAPAQTSRLPVRTPVVASAEITAAPPAPIAVAPPDVAPPAREPRETSVKPRGRVGSTLEQELPILQSAQEALRAGDTDRALAVLESHARRFPDGMLAPERRAVHAMAVCRKVGRSAGLAEAEAFLRDAPFSPLAPRVRAVCSL